MRVPVREQDIDIMLKTNQYVQGKEWVERADFRGMFEGLMRRAREEMGVDRAEKERRYGQA